MFWIGVGFICAIQPAQSRRMLDSKGINHILTHSHDYPKPEVASFHLSQILGKGTCPPRGSLCPANILNAGLLVVEGIYDCATFIVFDAKPEYRR